MRPRRSVEAEPLRVRDDGGFVWLAAGLLLFLTFNSVMAVYHSKGDEAIVAFVATSYLNLVLLFGFLWLYKRIAHGSPRRNWLKASVWILTTLITISFTYMVTGNAADLTLSMTLLVWAMAAGTGVGAFSAFFEQARINQQPDDDPSMV